MSRYNRASLRGKGWKIFFGKEAPEHADPPDERPPGHIDLTPDETEDLLSAVPAPLGLRDTSEIEPVDEEADPYSTIEVEVPDGEDFVEARQRSGLEFLQEEPVDPAMMATIDTQPQESVVSQVDQQHLGPEDTLGEIYESDSFSDEGVPLPESTLSAPTGFDLTKEKVVPRPEVEAITPDKPETLDDDSESDLWYALTRLGASRTTDVPDFAKRQIKQSDLDLLKSDDSSDTYEDEAKG
jgi:hypothetical protein